MLFEVIRDDNLMGNNSINEIKTETTRKHRIKITKMNKFKIKQSRKSNKKETKTEVGKELRKMAK